ncbi:unnamed protein product [Moneuplotes crassus]|uniref:Uncharacterized protein n=1 Tax=Euplotes crassus TaxID=5936 RepID=A0AAD1UEB8_EUPCR|nr:unnamed protein product [Moneuplotes crassus]
MAYTAFQGKPTSPVGHEHTIRAKELKLYSVLNSSILKESRLKIRINQIRIQSLRISNESLEQVNMLKSYNKIRFTVNKMKRLYVGYKGKSNPNQISEFIRSCFPKRLDEWVVHGKNQMVSTTIPSSILYKNLSFTLSNVLFTRLKFKREDVPKIIFFGRHIPLIEFSLCEILDINYPKAMLSHTQNPNGELLLPSRSSFKRKHLTFVRCFLRNNHPSGMESDAICSIITGLLKSVFKDSLNEVNFKGVNQLSDRNRMLQSLEFDRVSVECKKHQVKFKFL